ncbi:U2 small nuclear ribonucleoprotein A [Actinidia rufa]|uniref:U2 small nuclear ribonucleoprotein A n=1 Tax=Actinidia rufa TaxID=165716 RepID=A0A7J0GME3_9ERIC|nr:U2 small nuclear ribonucleoprotein A [Actinidia rufa]
MVRLTADLIWKSSHFFNAIRERELDLRGNKIPVIENLGATEDQFDCIDLSDNEIVKLENFPYLSRLGTLLMNNNRITRINPKIGEFLPKLHSLVLTNNRLTNLVEIDPLASLPKLQFLSLLDNNITKKPNYRLYVIHKLKSLRLLDFKKVKHKERIEAQNLFSSQEAEEQAKKESAKTFCAWGGSKLGSYLSLGLATKTSTAAIVNSQTLEEVARLEKALRSGQLPVDLKIGDGDTLTNNEAAKVDKMVTDEENEVNDEPKDAEPEQKNNESADMKEDVSFRVDYNVPSIGREFGSVFLGDKNVSSMVVSEGWAKVMEQGQHKGEASPFLVELLRLGEQAKQQGKDVGAGINLKKLCFPSNIIGASETSMRNLPRSAIGDPSNFDAMGLLASNKGRPMQAIVEQVCDGSTLRVYLLPEFQFVQVFVAGIQAPSTGRRAASETVIVTEKTSGVPNGEASASPLVPLTSAQGVVASSASSLEVSPDPFGREVKHFKEIHALSREVRVVLEGVDKFSNLIGSIYYPDDESAKDLALELVENVNVSMEYSRKIGMADGRNGPADSRVMDFGSVFLLSSAKAYWEFKEKSNYYDALLSAESRAITGKKGIHSSKDSPVMHVADLTMASAKNTKNFLPFLQRKRMPAVVEYVLNGHQFKLFIPKETCSIAFMFSCVRCPGLMENVDKKGNFLGALWESKSNMGMTLLEAGLAKLQTSFGIDGIPDAKLLVRSEQSAKMQKLKGGLEGYHGFLLIGYHFCKEVRASIFFSGYEVDSRIAILYHVPAFANETHSQGRSRISIALPLKVIDSFNRKITFRIDSPRRGGVNVRIIEDGDSFNILNTLLVHQSMEGISVPPIETVWGRETVRISPGHSVTNN